MLYVCLQRQIALLEIAVCHALALHCAVVATEKFAMSASSFRHTPEPSVATMRMYWGESRLRTTPRDPFQVDAIAEPCASVMSVS